MILHSIVRQEVGLGHALRDFAVDCPLLLYGPTECVVARLSADGSATCVQGDRIEPVRYEHYFEARAFDGDRELRWHNTTEGGQGVIISERPLAIAGWTAGQELKCLDDDFKHPGYWLWGKPSVHQPLPEWTCLTTAIIGSLWVPIRDEPVGQRVIMQVREYWCEGVDGNVYVGEERLIGLTKRNNDA